jgi:thiol-disulfide isomerase/thioredoxin
MIKPHLFVFWLCLTLSLATGEANEAKNAVTFIEFLAANAVKPAEEGFEKCDLKLSKSDPGYIVLYFSAHWCPSCKKVTPRLVDFYAEQKKKHDNFEFVFVSSDRDEKEMMQYMKGYRMPWVGLKFDQKIVDKEIMKLAGRGIPCIVVIDSEGKVVASSFEGGKYQGPMKPVETLAKIMDDERATRALAAITQ